MQPPIPAGERDTTGLIELDAQLLAGSSAVGLPVTSSLSRLEVPLQARRSERRAGSASVERALEVVVPLVTATEEWIADDGYVERRTFIPSAGARHPLTALILHRSGTSDYRTWAISPSLTPRRFELTHHSARLQTTLSATAKALRTSEPPATLVVVLARFRRTLSKYPDGQTLVWRDAGVFLGAAHLLATGLGLHSCIVGVAGTTEFTLEGTTDTLVDVGALTLAEKEYS